MRVAACVLSAVAGLATFCASADCAAFANYAQIDGLFYSIPNTPQAITYDGSTNAWLLPTVSFWSCNPRSGNFPPYAPLALFYDPNYDLVFLKASAYNCYGGNPLVMCLLSLQSSSGDIACNGEIAPPDRIFGNGFELDRIFANGFQ